MKKAFLLLFVLVLAAQFSKAQCDKRITWYSETQSMLTTTGEVEDSREEYLEIISTADSIYITPANGRPLSGKITSKTCNWTAPYKTGKSEYKATLNNGERDQEATISLEGTAGKLYLYISLPKFQGKKVRVDVSRYEEK